MSYRIVFQNDARDIQTLYWNGSLDEISRLARQTALKCEADTYRIFDVTGAEVGSEKRPFQDQASDR
jgi:hypothetical protein